MSTQAINPHILGEAADWLVQLHSGTATAADRQAIEQWRQRSAEHAQAWQRAQAILGDFRSVPAGIALQTLKQAERQHGLGRRQALTRLGLLLLAGPIGVAWQHASWEQWSADQRTAVGEQKTLTLTDGTQVVLNTDSSLDIAFSGHERRLILLTGEILISTARDPAPAYRPFIVETPQGTARALGTRFNVRIDGHRSEVAVLEGAVELKAQAGGPGSTLQVGQRAGMRHSRVEPPESFDTTSLTWDRGMLLARNLRLAQVLDELGRYRPGVLRYQADVAEMRVSGAFSLKDTDSSLQLLQNTLPLKVSRLTRYWVSVESRV
ncbi:FecR domain-containing protein [Pseudomonas gingeri]|uniref:FecR domain-containing protein n=1 Tax=Pseudomonas sp. Ost2 TaxID=2678260 RepID=UPI001BB3C02F|nr:FecR family protein [Pseudomonas sp. Ost2]BBP75859.1 sigma factor regulator FemR [Pseudomonas sp. Ost2]